MPDVGEIRPLKSGGNAKWDGTNWRRVAGADVTLPPPTPGEAEPDTYMGGLVKGLKDYASELFSGTGTARHEVADFGKKEGAGLLSGVNPINQGKGLINLVTHPVDSVTGMVQQGSDALHGDPTAIGNMLSMVVAPKMDATMLEGLNKGATAVAENPAVRKGVGTVAGLGVGQAIGHPFMGIGIGRTASGLLEKPARAVADSTQSLMDLLHLGDGPGARDAAAVNDFYGGPKDTTPYQRPAATVMPNAPDLVDKYRGGSSGPAATAAPAASAAPETLESILQAAVDRGELPAGTNMSRFSDVRKPSPIPPPSGISIAGLGDTPIDRTRVPITSEGGRLTPDVSGRVPLDTPAGGPAPLDLLLKKPAQLTTAEWAELRGHYGAVKAGQLMGVGADDVRSLSGGGPSRLPIEAQNRISDYLARQTLADDDK